MSIKSGLAGVWRDLVELATFDLVSQAALVAFVLLPIASFVVVARGERRAWFSVAISAGLLIAWFAYHANTNWVASGALAFAAGVAGTIVGWLVLIGLIFLQRSSGSHQAGATR